MLRKIIRIDEEKCNGCGACAKACHEGAIGMVNGKAKLLRDDYCDGLGDCLPVCPTDAISFEMREAAAYDEAAVKANLAKKQETKPFVCPSSQAQVVNHSKQAVVVAEVPSQLMQWPVQIKLVPVNAPFFAGAKLLIAADCTAFAYGNFHQDFMKDHITLIGCPKLDDTDYGEKLTEILRQNDIQSIVVTRMQVPCCGGIQQAVYHALAESGKTVPCEVVTISAAGEILKRES